MVKMALVADMYKEQKDARREADCFDGLVARRKKMGFGWLPRRERERTRASGKTRLEQVSELRQIGQDSLGRGLQSIQEQYSACGRR